MELDDKNNHWRPPVIGFEVMLRVASDTLAPEDITSSVGIEPTTVRYAKDEVRKYHNWHLRANSSLTTLQEHIDEILTRVQPHVKQFRQLDKCSISLDVYIYKDEYESFHHSHPSFYLEDKNIALLHEIGAAFTLD